MEKVTFGESPDIFVDRGNGTWYYHFGIEEISVENEEGKQETRFAAYQVVLHETITQDKVTEAVLSAIWGNNMEQKLLNDYFAYENGLLDESARDSYIAFLEQRKALKEQIAIDCGSAGILKTR